MPILDLIFPAIDREADIIARVIERAPGDRLDWNPQPKLMPLPKLFIPVCVLVVLVTACAKDDERSKEIDALRSHNASLTRQIAGKESYVCTVRAAASLDDQGRLTAVTDDIHRQAVGATFTVDRTTGRIIGGVGNNASFETRQVVFTPPDNPFYVVSYSHGPNRNVEFLSIRDWATSPQKPFLLAESTFVFTGTCER
jgi:hypothetical protein